MLYQVSLSKQLDEIENLYTRVNSMFILPFSHIPGYGCHTTVLIKE